MLGRVVLAGAPANKVVGILVVLTLVVGGLPAGDQVTGSPARESAGLRQPVSCGLPAPARGAVADYQDVVMAKQAKTIAYDGAQVSVGAGATTAPVPVGITPLLKSEMAPLDTGMTNVTQGPRAGYRFTPHPFQFAQDIEISVPYDPALVDDVQDVHTYFFEESSGCWRPLDRVRVDEKTHVVVSRSNHFTDMINAVVTTPESPGTTSFDPTEIKDLTTADPGSKVNLVGAPAANNAGEAQMSYPIEAPPGRAGVQPQLAVGYRSGSQNGWLGVGWDLPVPSIAVDTRWGVPRYDARLETETYLSGGDELTPVAHRGPLVARTGEKVFQARTEGGFAKIVRHGAGPRTYSWEIVDRNGNRSFYGGPGATLADDAGNVFQWALREVRDTHGNVIRYHHAQQDDPGVAGGTVPGRDLYLQKITYTGDADSEGPYAITFIRDRDLEEPRRPDVAIDARGGFKRVTADLLRRIDVSLNDLPVRHYELNYTTGAFDKTLLSSITQFDENGQPFTTHTFNYYDDIRDGSGQYRAFAPMNWTSPDDGLGTTAGEAGALNSVTSRGVGGHLYVGAGPFRTKTGSVGVKAGYSNAEQEGLLALVDVDGDNLPDKVFKRGDAMVYRKNLARPGGAARFDDNLTPLRNLPGIFRESTATVTRGVESYLGVAAQLDHVDTFTTSDRYFSDVNADGLTDLVDGDAVLFGRIGADGVPIYGSAAGTPVPIGSAPVDASGLIGDHTTDRNRQIDSFPLVDTVRRWVAPFDGTVRVSGDVRLVADSTAGRRADGVRVAVQREDTELWAKRIGATDHSGQTLEGLDAITVRRGDRIYFRVQSVSDGADDQVAWDPTIAYTGVPATTDVNGLDPYTYQASRDFTLAGRDADVVAPANGTARLSGDLIKTAATTDDVALRVTRDGVPVAELNLPATRTGTVAFDREVAVQQGQKLRLEISTDSPIDLGALSWTPQIEFPGGQKVSPSYDADLYPVDDLTTAQPAYTAEQDGTLLVRPELTVKDDQPDTSMVFTVKARGQLLAKKVIEITGGQVPTDLELPVPVDAGQELFFDFSSRDAGAPGRIIAHRVRAGYDAGNLTEAPSALHAAGAQGAFPEPYRGWGVTGYNGNRDRAGRPIDQADLVIDDTYRGQLPADVDPQRDAAAFAADPRITPPDVIPFTADPAQKRWSAGDLSWAGAATSSSSRLGSPELTAPDAADYTAITTAPRVSRSTQISLTGGAGGGPISVGGSVASGDSVGELDYLDMNGDGFPDIVGRGGIKYTGTTGELSGATVAMPDGSVRKSSTKAGNASAGSAARTISTGRGYAAPPADSTAHTASAGNDMPPLGIGGSLGRGSSDEAFDLTDINGDSLPDRVYADGRVALNLGYRFAAAERWPGGALGSGENANSGVNIGFNTDFYGFAGGASSSKSSSSAKHSLADVNGDGLADQVFEGNPIRVALNTGSGFADPRPFLGSLDGINEDVNATLGAGGYLTFSACVALIFGCVITNPGADTSTGVSRSQQALRDIDGDGFADQLRSTKDDELVVAHNQTGRTNLLKQVNRPLGGKIQLDYERDGNTYDQPGSRYVMSRVAVSDGQAGDGQDTQLTTYTYAGGLYDRLEREFRGYQKVVEQQRDPGSADALFRSTTREFRTDSHYTRGLLVRTLTTDALGKPFDETTNTYTVRDVRSPSTPADLASPTATLFPQLTRTDTRYFEGRSTAGLSTYQEMSYDNVGNVVRTLDAGETGTADDVETKVEYSAEDAVCRAAGIIAAAKAVDVRGGGTLMRHRESTVSCVNGDVTQNRTVLADGTKAVTDLTYHPTGTIKSVTGPANAKGQRYKLDYRYDPATATHVTAVQDSFGLRSTSTYNLKYGLVEAATDVNGQTSRTYYDALGRVDQVIGPRETAENHPTIDYEYHPEAAVPYAVTRHVDRDSDGTIKTDSIDTITFADGLGRVLQVKKDATVSAGPGAAPAAMMTVSGRAKYDFAGHVVEQYYPTAEAKGPLNTRFRAAFDPVRPTRTSYDVLDRVTRVELPDATATTTGYGLGTDRSGATRFEATVTDANGKQSRNYTDVRDLPTAVRQENVSAGQAVIWTSYQHDPLGQITAVTDDKGNVTRSQYDNLGRRTALNSPDSGLVTTAYDPAGNIVKKVTANLAGKRESIDYTYDFNRLTAIRYPFFRQNNVTYAYGAPGATGNGAGRVIKVTDGAGISVTDYGPLGEKVKQTRTIQGITGRDESFTTQYRYDTWNRVLNMTYPDGEVLSYHYDSGGRVDGATGLKGANTYRYLTALEYDKFGQRTVLKTGNGTVTRYTYDAQDRRLATMQGTLASGAEFQHTDYGYDAVGNVTSATNATATPTRQSYTYDDLNRLVGASGDYQPAAGTSDRYQLTMSYDSLGNITAKDQKHTTGASVNSELAAATTAQPSASYANAYKYGGNQPHAPTTIGTAVYKYDADGNLVSRIDGKDKRQLVWDEEDRLACVRDGSGHSGVVAAALTTDVPACPYDSDVRFVYDADGNRVVKKTDRDVSVYPSDTYSERDDTAFKHIFIGSTRLVSKVVHPARYVEDNQFYYHADNVGSTGYGTDASGNLAEKLQYFPSGETWTDESAGAPTPYQFSGKELDAETGLYYYGARYYDPRTSVWQSPDPALPDYLDGRINGGVTNPGNLATYSYAYQNPVTLTDPDGQFVQFVAAGYGLYLLGAGVVAAGAYGWYQTRKYLYRDSVPAETPDTTVMQSRPKAGAVNPPGGGAIPPIPPIGIPDAGGLSVPGAGSGTGTTTTTGTNPSRDIAIDLYYRADWTPDQRSQARAKVIWLDIQAGSGRLYVTPVNRRKRDLQAAYRKKMQLTPEDYRDIYGNCAIDHCVDLQLSGQDVDENLRPLDVSVNSSLGKQIDLDIKRKGGTVGTRVIRVTITDRQAGP